MSAASRSDAPATLCSSRTSYLRRRGERVSEWVPAARGAGWVRRRCGAAAGRAPVLELDQARLEQLAALERIAPLALEPAVGLAQRVELLAEAGAPALELDRLPHQPLLQPAHLLRIHVEAPVESLACARDGVDHRAGD